MNQSPTCLNQKLSFLNLFLIKFVVVKLICKTIFVSSAQFNKTQFNVICIVYPLPKESLLLSFRSFLMNKNHIFNREYCFIEAYVGRRNEDGLKNSVTHNINRQLNHRGGKKWKKTGRESSLLNLLTQPVDLKPWNPCPCPHLRESQSDLEEFHEPPQRVEWKEIPGKVPEQQLLRKFILISNKTMDWKI